VRALARLGVTLYLVLATLPLLWMALTAFKQKEDAISLEPRFVPSWSAAEEGGASARAGGRGESGGGGVTFQPTIEAFERLSVVHAAATACFWRHLWNSALIGLGSTILSVALGTLCAYGFSRFRVPGAKDWLFFILSTRFLPPLAVVIPILLMYRELELTGTHLGLVLLYTAFNLSLSVWLMKGFIDEIPRAFEEAALVDGYSRLQAFVRVILPQARTGMAVTAVFCLISAWNEYGFAITLNNSGAITVPAYFAGLQGNLQGMPWPQVAAGALLFVAPIVLFTILVRRHLLRGITFGTVKQ
jgi:multiple sugar transport system permease protein